MNRTTFGTVWRDTARRIAGLWSAKSVAEGESVAAPASTRTEDIETQEIEVVALKLSPQGELEAQQQGTALSTWEDEGGASSKSKGTAAGYEGRR